MKFNDDFFNRGVFFLSIFLLVPVFSQVYADADGDSGGLRAGVSKRNITPQKPVTLAGYASRKDLSQGTHDPLAARVIAWEAGGKRLVLVSTDLLGFYNDTVEWMREGILEEFDLQPSELFLTSIHTHAAPSLTLDKDNGHPNNLTYTRNLRETLIRAIRDAFEDMGPVRAGAGVGYSSVGMNRRQTQNDGIGKEAVGYVKLGRNPYGPTDKEVLVLKLAKREGSTKAVLFDYATHGTSLGPKNYMVSGDVLGLAEQFVEKYLGDGIIAPAFAGASGDIDPWYRILPEFHEENGWIPEPVLLGTLLGEEVAHVYRDIEQMTSTGVIASQFVITDLPGKPEGGVAVPKDHPSTPLALTVAKVGDVAFVGMGAEALTEIGMAIKEASPFEFTFVITHCNGAAGYLAPAKYFKEGGYEIQSSPFAPQAADLVVKKIVRMLHDL